MSKVGRVYLGEVFVGTLKSSKSSYTFEYDKNYLSSNSPKPISLSLPLSHKKYESKNLFPFFEGLLAEGWLRKRQEKEQKIDSNNSFELLLENGKDCIGAVTVLKDE